MACFVLVSSISLLFSLFSPTLCMCVGVRIRPRALSILYRVSRSETRVIFQSLGVTREHKKSRWNRREQCGRRKKECLCSLLSEELCTQQHMCCALAVMGPGALESSGCHCAFLGPRLMPTSHTSHMLCEISVEVVDCG